MPDFLHTPRGEKIAYEMSEGWGPPLIWCGGLKSDMEGSKAVHLHRWAKARGQAFIRFDYYGHGQSSGDFIDGTMSQWAKDIESIRDVLCEGPVILIGSSMYEPSGYDEPYAYSKALIEDGRARQILDLPIPVTCPIRILQGYEDTVVPWAHSKRLLDMLTSKDLTYTLVAGGDHSLSRDGDLKLIETALDGLS